MENNTDTQVVDEKVEQETTQKTYTKEDLDNSFNAGVKKANSDWQKDEKYKEFLEWKKSSQNDSEKINSLQNENVDLQNQNSELQREINVLKATNKVSQNDVKPEFLKFVTNEILGMVNDTIDFDTALKNYKKENPHFFGEVVIKKVQSSPSLATGGKTETSTNDIMNDIIRSARKD